MTSPHHQGKIPWHCLTDHVDFDGSTGFKIRPASQIDSRKKAFAHFTHVLASLIADVAEDQLSVLPKPNASPDAWRDVGVQDNALFPVDVMDAIGLSVPADINQHHRGNLQYWEPYDAGNEHDIQFILLVLTKPANPFRHLAPLIYLAQHPRVWLRNVLSTTGLYDTAPGLRSFTLFTVSYYLLLNMVLALDSGASFDKGMTRASLFHARIQNGRPPSVPSSNGNKDPHTAFWYSAPPAYQNPDLRALYSLHCFRLLVALYAIMKETTLRDVAIGINYYDINPLYGRNTSRFDKCTLVDTICRAFKSISPVFSDLEPSLVGDPPATLPHDPPESNLSDQPKRKPQQQSHFVGLPTEIHQYIYSFFPDSLRSLANLAATCSRLREICTPLIYAEPFPAPTFTVKYPHHLRALSAALVDVLSSELHLASHIRRLSVRVEGILGYPPLQYPPLQLCLADMFTHLMEVNLYVPSECEDCVAKREGNESLDFTCRFKTTEAIAAVTRRWPNLSSFSLFSLGAGESHLDGAPTPSPTPAVLIPHNLEKLRISYTPVTPVSLATRKALMNASSHTLRHLVLHYERVAMDDLPVFPSLERLELATGLPIEDIRPLLQKSFSSVRFLSLDSTYDLPESPGITLDLSGIFDDLEHLSVSTSWLVLSRLIVPPSVVTVQVHYFYNGYPSLIVSGPLHLPALSLRAHGSTIKVFDVFVGSSEDPSSAFQTVRSLELRMTAKPDDLPRLAEMIATRVPKLEVLILKIKAFSNRPRREDYPMDDGLDDVQKAAALSFFETCPGLNTISFNGVPDVWDPIGSFPARVWTRDSGDGGAHMTGRAALPWKVGEIWDRSLGAS